MNILDNLDHIKRLDKSNVLESIDLFPKQCLQALEETEKLKININKSKIKNILVTGMGGSAFASEIVKTLFKDKIDLPYEINRDYILPYYINNKSLVIASSYSGNTAETISSTKEALKRKATILALTNNGQLESMVKNKKVQGYVFNPKYNPCGQPRVGVGYMVCGHIGILIKTGLVNTTFNDIKKAIKEVYNKFKFQIPEEKNLAKKFAKKIHNKFVFVVSSEFLNGASHGFANQLNETAKSNSIYHYIPELNHHRMEGLKYPDNFSKNSIFIFYLSNLYDKRNQLRYGITKNVIEKNNYKVLEYQLQANNKISQAFEAITFNSYVSFYLAMLNNLDPNKIPWVDYFKKELKKQKPA